MSVWTIVVAGLAALLGTGGGAAIVTALSQRKKTQADVVGALTDSALELVKAAKEEAREARKETHETRVQMRAVRREADEILELHQEIVGYLRRVVRMIHDPTMTLERLRVLVGDDPPNGAPSSRT